MTRRMRMNGTREIFADSRGLLCNFNTKKDFKIKFKRIAFMNEIRTFMTSN